MYINSLQDIRVPCKRLSTGEREREGNHSYIYSGEGKRNIRPTRPFSGFLQTARRDIDNLDLIYTSKGLAVKSHKGGPSVLK